MPQRPRETATTIAIIVSSNIVELTAEQSRWDEMGKSVLLVAPMDPLLRWRKTLSRLARYDMTIQAQSFYSLCYLSTTIASKRKGEKKNGLTSAEMSKKNIQLYELHPSSWTTAVPATPK